jgi:hypothetical protein
VNLTYFSLFFSAASSCISCTATVGCGWCIGDRICSDLNATCPNLVDVSRRVCGLGGCPVQANCSSCTRSRATSQSRCVLCTFVSRFLSAAVCRVLISPARDILCFRDTGICVPGDSIPAFCGEYDTGAICDQAPATTLGLILGISISIGVIIILVVVILVWVVCLGGKCCKCCKRRGGKTYRGRGNDFDL